MRILPADFPEAAPLVLVGVLGRVPLRALRCCHLVVMEKTAAEAQVSKPQNRKGRRHPVHTSGAVAVFSWVSFCATFIMETGSLGPKKAATCSAKAV